MEIGKHYKVESDRNNVTLFKKGKNKKTGADTWHTEGYYPTVKAALHGMVEIEIKETELKDLQTVLTKITELHNLIETLERSELGK